MSLIRAELAALRMLYEIASPDAFVILSARDYPVAKPELVLNDLSDSRFDAFLSHRPVPLQMEDESQAHWWIRLAKRRYIDRVFPGADERNITIFSQHYRCFAGEHWLSGKRTIVPYLLDDRITEHILHYFSSLWIPDEAVYQTILCNEPRLSISSHNYRYTDWSNKGRHPKWLGVEDIPSIVASECHFARKFHHKSLALDYFDKALAT